MSETVMRYQLADYLNVGTDEAEEWAFMGVGFNTLDENPTAQAEGKVYIHEKAQTSKIKSYQTQFPFDTDLISDEKAIMALYNIGRNQKTGSEAELEYVRVELFKTATQGNEYPARKFKVSVEVATVAGAGGEAVKVTGNLNGVGNFVEGTFNTSTKQFTETAA